MSWCPGAERDERKHPSWQANTDRMSMDLNKSYR
jgi:hypothetical protein